MKIYCNNRSHMLSKQEIKYVLRLAYYVHDNIVLPYQFGK